MRNLILVLFLIAATPVLAMSKHGPKDGTEITWAKYSPDAQLNLLRLLEFLSQSPTGKKLIRLADEKAQMQEKSLYEVIKPGEGSITDTTLVRKFTAGNPEDITYETRSMVYINHDLGLRDAILDLAHELTHFIYRSAFNPYLVNFSLDQFIVSTVEGAGGEVDAFIMECMVMSELYPKYFSSNNNCQKIKNNLGDFDRTAAIKEFYRLGGYHDEFKKILARSGIDFSKFKNVSTQSSTFISSAYGLPYPIAATQEYQTVLARACDNDRKRMEYFKQKNRTPASVDLQFTQFAKSYQKRCR
jgi:hypothetical protein